MCRNLMWAFKYYDTLNHKFDVRMWRKVSPDDDINSVKYTMRNMSLPPHHSFYSFAEPIQIPCGQCIECRLANSRDWANRCMLEAQYYSDNYFVTLTYDPDHLPMAPKIDLETGEVLDLEESGTLVPEHLQTFMKDLREYWRTHFNHVGIRFFACGEYGEQKARPHYHLILFNCPIFDLRPDHKSKKGNMNFVSDVIFKIWKKGRIAVGSVTWDSCAYTARYVLKKINGQYSDALYDSIGKAKEFVRMSRRPGIGRQFYEDKKDVIYATDEIFIPTGDGVMKVKPARYYDKLYDIDYEDDLKRVKEARADKAEMALKVKYSQSDKTPEEQFRDKIESDDLKYKSLKRKYEKDGSI